MAVRISYSLAEAFANPHTGCIENSRMMSQPIANRPRKRSFYFIFIKSISRKVLNYMIN